MEVLTYRRLTPSDAARAREVFKAMAVAFENDVAVISTDYVHDLLRRTDFLVVAAFAGDVPVGGLTGFLLPTTQSESTELFIYDIAVVSAYRRKGIGKRLVETARQIAETAGVEVTWVPADNEDVHALDFYKALGGIGSPVTVFTFK